MKAQFATIDQPFSSAYEKVLEITTHLHTEMSGNTTHSAIEAYLETDGRELLRLLLHDHLDDQGAGRLEDIVCGADGVVRSHTGAIRRSRPHGWCWSTVIPCNLIISRRRPRPVGCVW